MRFILLTLGVTLSAFGLFALLASGALGLLWPILRPRLRSLPAPRRASWLSRLCLTPMGLALFASLGLVLPAFLVYEPRETREILPPLVVALAAAGILLAALGFARLLIGAWKTRRVVKAWSAGAERVELPGVAVPAFRVDLPVPVVALAGWRHPRLFVAATVLDRCDSRLVAAMAAHESGHRRSGDNLKRLVLRACASPLDSIRVGREMFLDWEGACEEAADDAAIHAGARAADLADALLAVARLAPACWPAIPAAAFYRGDSLERRVRRLVAGVPPVRGRSRVPALVVSLLLIVGWLLAMGPLLQPLHQFVEWSINGSNPELRGLVVDPFRS